MNYQVQGIEVLLCEDCILKYYYPLIPYKEQLVKAFLQMNCPTRDHCLSLTDDELIAAGLRGDLCGLFRRFLHLYDYKGKGIRDIPDAENRPDDEVAALLELMLLPGVKTIRAQLYFHCGLKSLRDFAAADWQSLQNRIAQCIEQEALPYSLPLPKELRTQIAVAKAFTIYQA